MTQTRRQKIKQLRTKLQDLEEVKLKDALAKYGEAYQDSGGAWQENAAWELADEEISVLRAMIVQVKAEIRGLEHSLLTNTPSTDPTAKSPKSK